MRKNRAESGFIAVEYAAAIGLLLIPVTLLAVTLPKWPERQTIARVAAEEAVRAAVLADDWETGTAAGQLVAEQVVSNWGLDAAEIDVTWPNQGSGPLAREASITVDVEVTMPALSIPGIGVFEWGPGWHVQHTEAVDRYRSIG